MALSLIVRNASKLQGVSKLPQNLLKLTTVSVNEDKRNFSVSAVRHSDHGKIWAAERVLAISLLGIVPAALIYPTPILDHALALTSVVHLHCGLEACVIDYVRPVLFGNVVPKIAIGILYLISGATLGGLFYYNTNDIGIGKTVQKIWEIVD